MEKSGSKWLGGPNFVWAPQWGSGKNNKGDERKRIGSCMRKRLRFNPNPTPRVQSKNSKNK